MLKMKKSFLLISFQFFFVQYKKKKQVLLLTYSPKATNAPPPIMQVVSVKMLARKPMRSIAIPQIMGRIMFGMLYTEYSRLK